METEGKVRTVGKVETEGKVGVGRQRVGRYCRRLSNFDLKMLQKSQKNAVSNAD